MHAHETHCSLWGVLIAGYVLIELVNEPRDPPFYSLNLSTRLLVHFLNYYVMMKGPNKSLKPQMVVPNMECLNLAVCYVKSNYENELVTCTKSLIRSLLLS